jgi:hypothetical protein
MLPAMTTRSLVEAKTMERRRRHNPPAPSGDRSDALAEPVSVVAWRVCLLASQGAANRMNAFVLEHRTDIK